MTGAGYQHLFELGRGGMGSAHLARAIGAEGFERLVVIKRLLPHLMEHPDAIRRFLGEARVAAALHHSNIVGVQHSGRDEQGYYIVYDYVEGAALDELVDRVELRMTQLPIPIMLRVALDALHGLHAAHTARDNAGAPLGILHRDISPENLLVGRDGVTRVLDFGIAKSAIASVTTDQNYLVGKLMFMAPEYLARGPTTAALDVYALGVSLWVALTGEAPWPGATEAQLVTAITLKGVPAVSSKRQVPGAIDELIARATALKPEERFADALQMIEAIEKLDRATGWLATHREVAALVDAHCGVDLERRRERISAASRVPDPVSSTGPVSLPVAGSGDGSVAATTNQAHQEQFHVEYPAQVATAPVPLVQQRRKEVDEDPPELPLSGGRWWIPALLFSVIAAGLVAVFWLRGGGNASPEPTPDPSALAAASTPHAGPDAGVSGPAPSAQPVAASTATTNPSPAGTQRANGTLPKAPTSPSAAASVETSAVPVAAPPKTGTPVSTGDPGINKQNPYRRP
ncbi:MAG: serine/threonine protein kinase [Polyangiaceae bacterium]